MKKIEKLLFLAALASSACAPAADEGTLIGNGTGIPGGSLVDIDGDGKADGVALDTDGDGKADAIDTNRDGISDGPLPANAMVVGDGSGNGGEGGNNNSNAPVDPNDRDNDGFTPDEGDCEDGSADINPGAFDFPGNAFDEDCDGTVAKTPAEAGTGCDEGLAIDSTDPMDAARAIGLCKTTTTDGVAWGVIEAKFTKVDGTGTIADPKMVGMLPAFGAARARQGSALLALSSGIARAPGQPDYTESCDSFGGLFDLGETPPEGYPKENSVCKQGGIGGIIGGIFPTDPVIYDQVALTVKLRVPTNARSFAFDSIFYSYEYPDFICSEYNDFFVVFKTPTPEFVEDGNIVFDSNKDPIGVNNGLLSVCNKDDQTPQAAKTFTCEQGTGLLAGTGFGAGESTCAEDNGMSAPGIGGAATGWLNTTAPVAPAEIITLTFGIWDTGDSVLDSTALIDNFVWSVNMPDVATTPIVF